MSLSAHPEHITSKPIIGRSLAMCSIEKLSYIRNAHRSIGIFVTVHKFTTIARNRLPSALHVQSRPGHQTPNRTRHVARSHNRHPELGSGSISRLYPSAYVARWMLKRVQHDVVGNTSLRPLRLCVNSLICHSCESGELIPNCTKADSDLGFPNGKKSDSESSRVFRRLLYVRRSYNEQNKEQVFS